jgi:hypothetical protein
VEVLAILSVDQVVLVLRLSEWSTRGFLSVLIMSSLKTQGQLSSPETKQSTTIHQLHIQPSQDGHSKSQQIIMVYPYRVNVRFAPSILFFFHSTVF